MMMMMMTIMILLKLLIWAYQLLQMCWHYNQQKLPIRVIFLMANTMVTILAAFHDAFSLKTIETLSNLRRKNSVEFSLVSSSSSAFMLKIHSEI